MKKMEAIAVVALLVVALAVSACAVNGKPTAKSTYEEAGGSSEFATHEEYREAYEEVQTEQKKPGDPADTLPPVYGDNVVVDDRDEEGHIDDPTPAQEPMPTRDPSAGTEVGKNDNPGPFALHAEDVPQDIVFDPPPYQSGSELDPGKWGSKMHGDPFNDAP